MRRPFQTHLRDEDGELKEILPAVELGIALLTRGRSWGQQPVAAPVRTFRFDRQRMVECDPRYQERTHGDDLVINGAD